MLLYVLYPKLFRERGFVRFIYLLYSLAQRICDKISLAWSIVCGLCVILKTWSMAWFQGFFRVLLFSFKIFSPQLSTYELSFNNDIERPFIRLACPENSFQFFLGNSRYNGKYARCFLQLTNITFFDCA